MLRKIIVLFAVVFFMALIMFTGMMFMTNTTEVYSQSDIKLEIEKPSFFTLSEPDANGKRNITLFSLPIGSYTLTERQLDNGTTVVFEHVENDSWLPFVVSLNMPGVGDDVRSWNPEPVMRTTDSEYGNDPTTNPFGIIAMDSVEILQGNIYVSRDLTLGNGELVNELRHEIAELTVEEGSLLKNFWLAPKHQADTWLMLSPEPFFSTPQDEEAWIAHTAQNPRERLNWLTPEGTMVKIALTDDLRTEMAYSIAPKNSIEAIAVQWQEKSPAIYFETILLNAETTEQQ
ncbi:MAG TPA: hypothetical protein VLQ20_07355 [Planococcus sp. (in: firmicutes)]|nr:hypothetical protein [Planococcus sp. (in: firmicutes)]